MKKFWVLIFSLFMVVVLRPSTAFSALVLYTGEPQYLGTYPLNTNRPIVAVEFTNSQEWTIDSIEAYFSISEDPSSIQTTIWNPHSTFTRPDISSVVFQDDITLSGPGSGWMGSNDLNWTLSPGTWWVGFIYASGGNAGWGSNATGGQNLVNEAQYSNSYDTWYVNDLYNLPIRIDDGSAVPVPSTLSLLAIGVFCLAGIGRKKN